ncbi:MAG TPA: TadE/TadG family type IV pilus assembly protein [Microthrixaceae bacterium]|jgi:Flp pilus assembly protein TadG|nr:pilus assembly protein [Acidimicrobiia bacterium]HMU78673.1 TadE/TadG family type IV pilus assembly protein [Microthrixaceae bacterium]HMX06704.1 TadE/TadG family type IV pilus assembly protein [Microthrixaceae bacterium]HMX66723.1 TadE/TadG family type IV pilus assembly protein [Microthrixaceae bacterium]HMY86780.1 TadE/TadG family type IV pilus assembly protein [Microthrixaceae bacterium]
MKRSSLDRRSERGSVSVEVAVIAPAFVFLMLLVVFAGKVSEADGNVERAAAEGARAASLRQHPGNAATDARSTVEANLATAGVSCSTLEAIVDTSDFEPGGTVTVTVECTASMADVTLLGVPGTRTFTATATEVIDTYRGDDGP